MSNLNDVGIVYEEKGELPLALKYYLEALKISEQHKDLIGMANAQINVGFIHLSEEDYEKAHEYFQKGLQTSIDAKYLKGEVWSYSNIGIALNKLKRYDEARTSYEKAMSYVDDGKHDRELGRLINNISITYLDEKNYPMALKYLLQSAAIKEKFQEPYDMATTYVNVADTYQKMSDYAKAIQYAEKSLALGKQSGTPDVMEPALMSLAKSYFVLKDYKKAYLLKEEQLEIQDSLYSLERLRLQREMMAKYDYEKKDQENDLLKKESELSEAKVEKQYYVILSTGLALILILFVTIVLWRLYVRKARINRWLNQRSREVEAKNRTLEKDIDEKNSLMNVVAHDLRSPLNKVKGLAQLIRLDGTLSLSQKEYLGIIEDVTEHGKRLIADLLVLNTAEATNQVPKHEVDLKEFIEECATEFHPQAKHKGITLHVKTDEVRADNKKVLTNKDYLHRIVDNLVSNAIKFSPQGKNVYVETKKNGQTFSISVRDEGPGMTDEDKKHLFKKFQRLSAKPTGGELSTGLGLAIVKQLVTQLDGNITVESVPSKGAAFEVVLPS
ncbi:MAG: tetratricopeptide repeat protein [Bacteroidia bacterium]|nr:tetratricopeptide repeat protein [Bacteroidia bacterium]